jgi:hypothetical protein
MPLLSGNLELSRCSHCSVARPSLRRVHEFKTSNHIGNFNRHWSVYTCGSCGGVVTAWAQSLNGEIFGHFPKALEINSTIPERPLAYLQQAAESLHAPAGAVMLAASAVDSMLKIKGYELGSLYSRIEKAASDNVITHDMALWAHEIRLDANDQRHADQAAMLPSEDDAKRILEFATTIAEIMFVLPIRVQQGRSAVKKS